MLNRKLAMGKPKRKLIDSIEYTKVSKTNYPGYLQLLLLSRFSRVRLCATP